MPTGRRMVGRLSHVATAARIWSAVIASLREISTFILEKRVTFELFENLTVVGYFGRPGVSRMGSRIEKLKPASQGEQLSG